MEMCAVQVQVPTELFIRVLVIDDDQEFQERLREFWEQQGCSVEIASNLQQGRALLQNNTYEIVIADVKFKHSSLTGDRFILEFQDKLRETKVFVVTAQGLNNIDHYNALTNMGYKVLDKSEASFADTLQDAVIETVQERTPFIEKGVTEGVQSALSEAPVSVSFSNGGQGVRLPKDPDNNYPYGKLIEETQETLAVWLRKMSKPNDPVIAMGSKVMSANELANAVEAGDEQGVTLIRLFMSEFKHQLGISVDKE